MAREETDPSDNMKELCVECAGTWKVACYGAWCPHSEFWDDFLEDGWEEGAYTPRSCCLRLLCGMLFLTLAPVWCCKALFYCLFLPCIFLWRAVKSGELFNSRHQKKLEKQKSEPLAYIEPAQPNHPVGSVL